MPAATHPPSQFDTLDRNSVTGLRFIATSRLADFAELSEQDPDVLWETAAKASGFPSAWEGTYEELAQEFFAAFQNLRRAEIEEVNQRLSQ
jgi:hypothetical protein